jgi:hypothetical protein
MERLAPGWTRRTIIHLLDKHRCFSPLSAFSDFYCRKGFFGKRLDCSLLLPYVCLSWKQIWANLKQVRLYQPSFLD